MSGAGAAAAATDTAAAYAASDPLAMPVAGSPVGLMDITNIAMHRNRATKRKLDDTNAVSDTQLARVVVEEHRLVAQVAGDKVAPPWFAPTLAQGFAQATQPVLDRLDRSEITFQNSLCCEDSDEIEAPRRGEHDPPDSAPTTVAARKALREPTLSAMEDYYGLSHSGALNSRVRRVARAYGVRLTASLH